MPHKVDIVTGVVLRRLRENAGVTQEVLSKRIGLSYQQLQKYESGQNRVSISRLFDIAEMLNVAPHILIQLVELEFEAEKF